MSSLLGSIGTTSKVSSANAAKLCKEALAIINDLRAIEAKFTILLADSRNYGIEARKENEGDLDLLARIAKSASARAHELACEEDAERVELAITSNSRPVRKGIAGWLDRAADKLA
jgi:hypothetical protein